MMIEILPSLARSAVFLAALATLGPALPAQEAPESESPQTAQRRARRLETGARIWWNQPRAVENLDLSDQQRQEMDAILESFLAERRERGQRMQALRQERSAALARGDWTEAVGFGDKLAQIAAELASAENSLVVEVVRMLTAEQRQTLAAEFPAVMQRPWVMGGAGAPGGRERAAQPPRQRP